MQYQNGNVYKYFMGQKNEDISYPFEKTLDLTVPFTTMLAINIDGIFIYIYYEYF